LTRQRKNASVYGPRRYDVDSVARSFANVRHYAARRQAKRYANIYPQFF